MEDDKRSPPGMLQNQEGQGLTEYVLILVLVAIIMILILIAIGGNVNNTYSTINSVMPHT